MSICGTFCPHMPALHNALSARWHGVTSGAQKPGCAAAGAVNVEAFANFSQALWAGGPQQSAGGSASLQFGPRTVDYSRQRLSTDEEARSKVRLACNPHSATAGLESALIAVLCSASRGPAHVPSHCQ